MGRWAGGRPGSQEVTPISDPFIRDASGVLCGVRAVVQDYALDAVSLERAELAGLVEEVSSGRRLGLIGLTPDEKPVGLLLYKPSAEAQVHADFIHVMRQHQTTGTEVGFLRSVNDVVMSWGPSVVTVESFISGTPDGLQSSLASLGYESYPRYLMVRDLATTGSGISSKNSISSLPAACRILQWGAATEEQVARLCLNAHAGRREPRMGGDSLVGAFTQIEGLARSRVFSAEISTLAMEGSAPVGVVMATRPTEEDLMIVEVAVAPARQGLGIGKAIMARTLREASLARAERAWLIVNAANRPATALYRSTGFSVSRPVINCRWRPPAAGRVRKVN